MVPFSALSLEFSIAFIVVGAVLLIVALEGFCGVCGTEVSALWIVNTPQTPLTVRCNNKNVQHGWDSLAVSHLYRHYAPRTSSLCYCIFRRSCESLETLNSTTLIVSSLSFLGSVEGASKGKA